MKHQNNKSRLNYWINLGLAAVAGSSGCISLIVLMIILYLGLLLDATLDSHPIFTVIAIIVGVLISLWALMQIALRAARAIEHRQYGPHKRSQKD